MGVNMETSIGRLKLKNPIMTASGTFGYGLKFHKMFDISTLGAICTKGLSLKPREGNPMPRICETPAGMLNSIGLENIGIEKFRDETLPKLAGTGATVIVNFFGESEDEYVETAKTLDGMDGVHGLEMNVSCPNVSKGGIQFGTDIKVLEKLTLAVRKATSLPLIVKLSPNVGDIKPFAVAVENGGADAISAINTLLGMSIDIKTGRPKLARVFGGLSGPAIKPVAVRMVYECANSVKIPIIGIGGITSVEDVVEFLLAGASAVQVGTFNFVDPESSNRFVAELEKYCTDNRIDGLNDIIGKVKIG
ncbi:MAG: dihydroorotate dehydrogenase [Nitrospinota bacterium]|nr:dihydroorotate dehydrogenase [Nitrospinota bacterium]